MLDPVATADSRAPPTTAALLSAKAALIIHPSTMEAKKGVSSHTRSSKPL
jgi:hypothetical protein